METRKYMPQEFPRIRNQYFWEHFLSWNVTLLRGGIPVVAFKVNSMSLVSLTHQWGKVQSILVCVGNYLVAKGYSVFQHKRGTS